MLVCVFLMDFDFIMRTKIKYVLLYIFCCFCFFVAVSAWFGRVGYLLNTKRSSEREPNINYCMVRFKLQNCIYGQARPGAAVCWLCAMLGSVVILAFGVYVYVRGFAFFTVIGSYIAKKRLTSGYSSFIVRVNLRDHHWAKIHHRHIAKYHENNIQIHTICTFLCFMHCKPTFQSAHKELMEKDQEIKWLNAILNPRFLKFSANICLHQKCLCLWLPYPIVYFFS